MNDRIDIALTRIEDALNFMQEKVESKGSSTGKKITRSRKVSQAWMEATLLGIEEALEQAAIPHDKVNEEPKRAARTMTPTEAQREGFGLIFEIASEYARYTPLITQNNPFSKRHMAKLHHVWMSGVQHGMHLAKNDEAEAQRQERVNEAEEQQKKQRKEAGVRAAFGFLMAARPAGGPLSPDQIFQLVQHATALYEDYSTPIVESTASEYKGIPGMRLPSDDGAGEDDDDYDLGI